MTEYKATGKYYEDFKFGEDEFLLMRESDILAIIS